MIVNQLDVIDAGIDGGGKVLLVARGFVERGLYAGAQLGGELRARLSGKELFPVQCDALCPRQENWQAALLVVSGTVTLCIVHTSYFHAAWSKLGIGNPDHLEATVGDGGHQSTLAF